MEGTVSGGDSSLGPNGMSRLGDSGVLLNICIMWKRYGELIAFR